MADSERWYRGLLQLTTRGTSRGTDAWVYFLDLLYLRSGIIHHTLMMVVDGVVVVVVKFATSN